MCCFMRVEKGRERDMTIYVTKCLSPTKTLVCSQTLLTANPFWDACHRVGLETNEFAVREKLENCRHSLTHLRIEISHEPEQLSS